MNSCEKPITCDGESETTSFFLLKLHQQCPLSVLCGFSSDSILARHGVYEQSYKFCMGRICSRIQKKNYQKSLKQNITVLLSKVKNNNSFTLNVFKKLVLFFSYLISSVTPIFFQFDSRVR